MAITVTHDHAPSIERRESAVSVQPPHVSWKALAPIVLALVLALIPPPEGLAPHAWYFFAIFAGVILGLMLEPLPGGAIGLIGVTVVTVLSQFVLFAPAELAKPGFKAYNAALTWALSGFCQHHGVADLRRVHVRPRLREDRARQADLAAAGQEDGPAHADAGLRRGGRGHAARAVHAVEHRALGRHDLSGDPQPARALRQQAERSLVAAHRLVHHVGRDRHHLRDELDVPDRPRAQPARDRDGQQDRQGEPDVDAVVRGVRCRSASCCSC